MESFNQYNQILKCKSLSASERILLCIILDYEVNLGFTNLSIKKLKKESDFGRSTIIRALDSLNSKNVLRSVSSDYKSSYNATNYYIPNDELISLLIEDPNLDLSTDSNHNTKMVQCDIKDSTKMVQCDVDDKIEHSTKMVQCIVPKWDYEHSIKMVQDTNHNKTNNKKKEENIKESTGKQSTKCEVNEHLSLSSSYSSYLSSLLNVETSDSSSVSSLVEEFLDSSESYDDYIDSLWQQFDAIPTCSDNDDDTIPSCSVDEVRTTSMFSPTNDDRTIPIVSTSTAPTTPITSSNSRVPDASQSSSASPTNTATKFKDYPYYKEWKTALDAIDPFKPSAEDMHIVYQGVCDTQRVIDTLKCVNRLLLNYRKAIWYDDAIGLCKDTIKTLDSEKQQKFARSVLDDVNAALKQYHRVY